jgi:hypothetical protein
VILLLAAATLLAAGPEAAAPAAEGQVAPETDRSQAEGALLENPPRRDEPYDALVSLGVSLAQAGQEDAAAERLAAALEVDPRRPEAWLERGGLRFKQRRYREAIRDLQSALDRQDDAFTRDLLATSLFLSGRQDEALAHWNRMGRPSLRLIHLTGLEFTQGPLVRGEIPLREGERLDLGRLRTARLRLAELGVLDRSTLRPVPLADGQFDLDVALMDRRGFARSPLEFGVVAAVNVVSELAQIRYVNLGGRGVTLGARYRWDENRPDISLGMDWPRPLGLPGKLRLHSSRGRQRYSLDQALDLKIRVIDLTYRRVVGSRTVLEAGPRVLWRSFSVSLPSALPDTVAGLQVGLERRLGESYRHRTDARIDCLGAVSRAGRDYARLRGVLVHKIQLGPSSEAGLGRSVLALRVQWGGTTRQTPIDDWFAPGASAEMELPLRAHLQHHDGILGGTPLTRGLALANLEWRQRLVRTAAGEAGFVLFYDSARISSRSAAESGVRVRRWYHDCGVGARVALAGATVVRLDWGVGLNDDRTALTVGLNQTF